MPCRASLLSAIAALTLCAACQGSRHGRIASFTRPPVPAGFTESTGTGWRIAVPSTWIHEPRPDGGSGVGIWVSVDPQAVEDFQANVNVVREPFASESYDYAQASEHALRRDPRATIEKTYDDVVDGDPTLIVETRWAPIAPATVAYRTLQTDLASRGTGYVVTCSVAATAFERYRSTCDAIIRSFAIER
jgi:hypothetical protein